MPQMTDCPRLGKLFGRCRFKPRYDLGPADASQRNEGPPGFVISCIEASKPKTYIHDVCETCGKTVRRS